mgnify:CR=1 FL=1
MLLNFTFYSTLTESETKLQMALMFWYIWEKQILQLVQAIFNATPIFISYVECCKIEENRSLFYVASGIPFS